ncbi:acetyl-CoA carboxylase biotin carboxylase subunit [Microbacterium ginsengiterrae]|uniref:biotin carboxylase n=1 Tax=Microbacterium ginsengiterrae TaxID=546115 RepID=A0A7W9CCN7_9MICO|nr:acetyl-CoA carboxylase biotin carboxylase subunit [Microbacterium ginsengiterrae]
MTERVFVANRGEIAVRIIEACDRLGYETVLGVSLADRSSLAARRAGRVVVLGGPQSRESYLSVDAVLQAAISTGCTALHPGYGFLSERPDLARGCADNGIVFVGPSPEALEALGDKLSARALAERLDVPVSAGGTAENWEDVSRLAEEIGFPVLVKAAYGGGGRGMKLVHSAAELADAWSVASSEAAAAFGDGTVFLERYVASAKHIEVQILGDRHGNRIHLGERECSVQYRYQKVVEESPSTSIDATTREVMTTSALKIAAELDYVGLGTVEFLYDVGTRQVAFLEVNPRLQVEHPVTEQVTGVDLVRQQLLAALGEPIEITQADAEPEGHALEVRITAQDPDRDLMPTPGHVAVWRPPFGGGIRLDSHIYQGYDFPPFYDALMGKLITWGADRDAAIARMVTALDEFAIDGITTSQPLLRRIVTDPVFAQNDVTTHWLGDTILSGGAS